MSHTVDVKMIADQEIKIKGRTVNIYDITSIVVDSEGKITDARLDPQPSETYTGWLSDED